LVVGVVVAEMVRGTGVEEGGVAGLVVGVVVVVVIWV